MTQSNTIIDFKFLDEDNNYKVYRNGTIFSLKDNNWIEIINNDLIKILVLFNSKQISNKK